MLAEGRGRWEVSQKRKMIENVLVNVIPRMLYYWLWQWKYWIFNQGQRRSFPGPTRSGNRALRLRLHGNGWIFDQFEIHLFKFNFLLLITKKENHKTITVIAKFTEIII